MNIENLKFTAYLFLDIDTTARNTLLSSVSPVYKSMYEEFRCALSDPRLHCRRDSVIVFEPLASQIVLQRSKHVKILWCQIGAVCWMGQHSVPHSHSQSAVFQLVC